MSSFPEVSRDRELELKQRLLSSRYRGPPADSDDRRSGGEDRGHWDRERDRDRDGHNDRDRGYGRPAEEGRDRHHYSYQNNDHGYDRPPPRRRGSPPYAADDDSNQGPSFRGPPGPPPMRPPLNYNSAPQRYNEGPPGSSGGGWGNRGERRHDGRPNDLHRGSGGMNNGSGGADHFLASRSAQREAMNEVTIWPASPREPYLDSDEEREKKRKERKEADRRHRSSRSEKHHSSSRRHHHRRSSRYSDGEEEDAKRRSDAESGGKDRKRHRSRSGEPREHSKHHSSSSRRHEKSRSHRHRSRQSGDDRSEVDEARDKEPRHTSRSESPRRERSSRRSGHRRRSPSDSEAESEADNRKQVARVQTESKTVEADAAEEDSDVEIGPQLPMTEDGKPVDPRSFGGALLPGEGSAMAAFVAEGKRIPRRGEIALSSDQIESYEKAGFVMSGSRHRRMNAVRMRKENQVISAEEKRSILQMQKEEKMKKEAEIVSQFKEMVDTLQPPGR